MEGLGEDAERGRPERGGPGGPVPESRAGAGLWPAGRGAGQRARGARSAGRAREQCAAGQPAAPAAPVAIRTAYTTAGASMAALWLADETGAFKEQGLDAEVAFIGAGQAILGALSSQEAPIVLAGAN